ncbi:efflux RND transporter permease subunit [Acetobacter oeni]|uniref:Transport system membrane protein n=1 Tax=Acetobacter oeni TaxID=304077 RepID=A0A511XR14_9PROT|nr:efflux RND transporter permease subunit [Acetobacter oeni]MBB3884962.1 multidrug efflux pump [Acetobacter oeni]NHO20834.1 MMPL family transporter [Acetobacter oeni]GBR06780.1 multidrug efflux pump acriflavin resistance protein AcrB/AcrD/AcrF [Acetobacter oeni LMG 21952]GEN65339.1 transport system membrane protein [Acetobacter oeni]
MTDWFISRPVATIQLTLSLCLLGIMGYLSLPVSDLPNIDFPVIQVQALQPGGTPEQIARSIAEPLERHLGTIAGLEEMTSQSSSGMLRVTLQFALSRDINGAARDVAAAIQAARVDLPTTLRQNPTYSKANPNDPPALILALTSDTRTLPELYDQATNRLLPRISQIRGVGLVQISGSALPAVRVEINPLVLYKYGLGFEDIRAALASANAHTPKGFIDTSGRRMQLETNDQVHHAADYQQLVVGWRNGRPIHLTDVAEIVDGVEDVRNAGYYDGKPAIIAQVYMQAGANVVAAMDQFHRDHDSLTGGLVSGVDLAVVMDRSIVIRASLVDTQTTLGLSVVLVIAIVLLFLGSPRIVLVPAIVIPASLLGTLGFLWLLGYGLDNMSLMALTISTGFVVDDAIVVAENIARYAQQGMPSFEAARRGAREVRFTIVSITASLIVVFLPILLMGGLTGRLFHEFAITVSLTLVVSAALSLSLTPMLCARLETHAANNTFTCALENWHARMLRIYQFTLAIALNYRAIILLSLPLALLITVALYHYLPQSLFPDEDTGMLLGRVIGDETISFQAMERDMKTVQGLLLQDPDVADVAGFLGGRGSSNQGNIFIRLTDKAVRKDTVATTIRRLAQRTRVLKDAKFFALQRGAIRIGARPSNAAYQYSLQGDDPQELYDYTQRLVIRLKQEKMLMDVSSDVLLGGDSMDVQIQRDTAARVQITPQLVSNVLYDAYGQRAASVIYNSLNQYRVVMEVAPSFWQSPESLRQTWISTSGGSPRGGSRSNLIRVRLPMSATVTTNDSSTQSVTNQIANSLAGGASASSGAAVSTARETMIPLSVVATRQPNKTALAVNHEGQATAATISFNLPPGVSLNQAMNAFDRVVAEARLSSSIQGAYAGNAAQLRSSASSEPLLIAGAVFGIYIILGILYESYVHPLTVLSTLPSAGVGAMLGLWVFGEEFSLMAMIGLLLLVGIVKKNAIMLIDFAIEAERMGYSAEEAIRQACALRFRPIMMTTFAAAFGALPLVFGHGYGAELRLPLGITILGGLAISQALTLYTTPVLYLALDRFSSGRQHSDTRRHVATEVSR